MVNKAVDVAIETEFAFDPSTAPSVTPQIDAKHLSLYLSFDALPGKRQEELIIVDIELKRRYNKTDSVMPLKMLMAHFGMKNYSWILPPQMIWWSTSPLQSSNLQKINH